MAGRQEHIVSPDPWTALKKFTEARIGLGRCGTSLPLEKDLAFRLAHARAKDAVWAMADFVALKTTLSAAGLSSLVLCSRCVDRGEYLTRPDMGRRLADQSVKLFAGQPQGDDIAIVVCDGLSSPAIDQRAGVIISLLMALLQTTTLTIAPIALVENGRVAIGDEIGELLGARLVIVLIGERPGLTAPHSLGCYLTYHPQVGTTDEMRNCVANIRPGGLEVDAAVKKIAYLVDNAFRLQRTGIALKDRMPEDYRPLSGLPDRTASPLRRQ
ncbi:MAG: ethanolamine ammonia-lyase subunit EutC [Desulfopila sp.]